MVEWTSEGTRANQNYYKEIFKKLRETIRNKIAKHMEKWLHFSLGQCICSHSPLCKAFGQQSIYHPPLALSKHPPYSLYLALGGFYFFPKMKSMVIGRDTF